jgi:hypothetical protein
MHDIEQQEAMSLHSSAVLSVFNIPPSMEASLTNTLPVSYSIAVGTINTPQLLANMDNIIPTTHTMAGVLVNAEANRTIYGTEEATSLFRSLSPLSGNRQQLKANLMTRFMVTLSLHPEYISLCRIIQDPQYFGMGNHPIQVFFVAFQHNSTQVNLMLLNHFILLFSINLIKKDYVGIDLTDNKNLLYGSI